jgi:general secretion pathway protein D
VKTNLLLFLTPYIIKDQSDFRRIFERKLAERQAFVEQFYGQLPGYEVTVDFGRKAGPLFRMGQAIRREEGRLENGGPGDGSERLFTPSGSGPAIPAPEGTAAPPPLPGTGAEASPAAEGSSSSGGPAPDPAGDEQIRLQPPTDTETP